MLEKIKQSGFLLMAISMFFYALCEALEKYLTDTYEPYHIIFFRSLVGLSFVIWITFTRGVQSYGEELGWNLIRNFFAAVGLFLSIYSLKNLPLSSYQFMSFMAPVLMALLSAGLLKEKLPASVFISIILSIIGGLLMSYPFKDFGITLGLMLAFLTVFFNACASVTTKRLAHLDNHILYATYVLTCFFMSGFFSYADLHLDTKDIPLFILIAVVHFAGFQCLIFAFRQEDLVKLSPLEYTTVAWSIIFGYALWQYVPSTKEFLGGMLIVSGSIVVKRNELKAILKKFFFRVYSPAIIKQEDPLK